MRFNRFPLDEHKCKFEVGSTSLDDTRMVFNNHKLSYDPQGGNTILDYKVDIKELELKDRTLQYVDANYSLCGFEMKLVRNSAKYVFRTELPPNSFINTGLPPFTQQILLRASFFSIFAVLLRSFA